MLTPQFPYGGGLGSLYSQYLAYQLAPTIAYRVTDTISVGFAANLDLGDLSANPATYAIPTQITTAADRGVAYPQGTDGRIRFGGGFQVGVYYDPGGDWRFGAVVKSTQWCEPYTYNSVSPSGRPTSPRFNSASTADSVILGLSVSY